VQLEQQGWVLAVLLVGAGSLASGCGLFLHQQRLLTVTHNNWLLPAWTSYWPSPSLPS